MNIVKPLEPEMTQAHGFAQIPAMSMPITPARSVAAIARRLIETREAMGMNQTDLCTQANIARNTYNQWEKAKGRPSLDEAMKLKEIFNYSLDWIYFGETGNLPANLYEKILKRRAQ